MAMDLVPAVPPVFGSPPAGVACRQRRAAYAVIADASGRVAVLLAPPAPGRPAACWLPGGRMEPGETSEQTVLREIEEELGRRARVTGRIGEATQYFYAAADGCWYEMTAAFFRAELTEDPPTGPGEHEMRWIDPARESGAFFHACHAWAAGTGALIR